MNIYALSVLLFVNISVTHSWGRGDSGQYGPFHQALYSKYIKCNHDKYSNLDVSLVNVYFYDFSANEVTIFPIAQAADGILSYKDLDIMRRFVIFVAGFKSNINKTNQQRVRDAFSGLPNSYLIVLDHNHYTNDKPGYLKGYERAIQFVYYIGKALGEMLADLRRGGISAQSMHCIGHSLGGQMLAYTGQTFTELTGLKLWRITALDPAGPCFANSAVEDQIRSGLAEYVEVYHCNAGGLGSSSILADIDFFLNKNGATQPDCEIPLIPDFFVSPKSAKCSHKLCVTMYTATVRHPDWFLAWKCDSYKAFRKLECQHGEPTIAGFWNPGNATGVYYFTTEGHDLYL
ncbi:phospholipase A1-like [Leguminivora glycinivorella]|uniref:phospholipase A1-like n=1 Tax=Leguminivora glycinivorella TaxID=1035111 RepID=UPI00200E22EC|nr:phospholipase A1-like [Leguminivora glycinivorella]